MSSRTTLSSIPTLTQLFKNGQVKAAGSSSSLPSYSNLTDQVSLFQGDITTLEIDVIVNAANESLLGGGGVDGAIHRAAGSELVKECRTLKGAKTGEAKITKGYNLPAKHVIHTIGPIYSKANIADSKEKLKSAYNNSLKEASKANLESVAFPSISTGVYGYPMKDATNIAIETVGKYLESKEGSQLERVIFCVFSKEDYDVYAGILPDHFDHGSQ